MRRPTALILAIGLTAVACSPSDSETTTTTSSEASSTTETASAEPTTTEAPVETTTTTEVPASAGGSACVEGTWLLDIDSFISLMEDEFVAAGFGADAISASDGTYLVTMAPDGTFTAERDEWGFTVETTDGTFTMSVSGTETGTWSADDSTITVAVDSSDVTVSSTAEVDGQVVTLPNSPVAVPEAVAESSAYQCSGDVLTVTNEDVVITLNRA